VPVLQSAANNVARFDHNPVTGESLGLLIEEQRTNLLLRSEEFDDAAWTKTRSTITANTIVAPDGTLTGDKIVEGTDASTTRYVRASPTTVASTAYSFSVYLKAAERTFARIQMPSSGWGTTTNAFINLTTGEITAGSEISVQNAGNGWWRLTVTKTAATTSPVIDVGPAESIASAAYTGDGYSGIYIWGAQLEAGAFPTSYIPTVASQVTRSADAASMTGANFSSWYRADEGTLYSEASRPFAVPSGQFLSVCSIDDGSTVNVISNQYITASSAGFSVRSGNVVQAGLFPAAPVPTRKLASAYKVDDFATSANGGAVLTDTSGTIPVVNETRFGASGTGAGVLNGHIRKVSFYPKRLADAELQALTQI
jgi:hypothetical protein